MPTPSPTNASEMTMNSGRSFIQSMFGSSVRSITGKAIGSMLILRTFILSSRIDMMMRLKNKAEIIVHATPMPSVIAKPLISCVPTLASTKQTIRFVTLPSTIELMAFS